MTSNHDDHTGADRPRTERPRIGRAEAEALVPWVVAGRATPEEALDVEAAARWWPEIGASLTRARTERNATRVSGEAFGTPGAGALDRLMASIQPDPARVQASRRQSGGPGWVLDWLGGLLVSLAPRRLGALGAAAAGLVVIASGVIGYQADRLARPATYTTASGPVTPLTAKGPHALVTFRPDVTAGDIGKALSALGAEIVSGPQAGATYRVRLQAKEGESDDAALARLMATEVAAFGVLAK
jgi:hypothetical protein